MCRAHKAVNFLTSTHRSESPTSATRHSSDSHSPHPNDSTVHCATSTHGSELPISTTRHGSGSHTPHANVSPMHTNDPVMFVPSPTTPILQGSDPMMPRGLNSPAWSPKPLSKWTWDADGCNIIISFLFNTGLVSAPKIRSF